MYWNFSIKQFCLLTVNGTGRDLTGERKFVELQGVYCAGKTRFHIRLNPFLRVNW